MLKIKRTDAINSDFIHLVKQLDLELAERDGPDHAYYAQFNNIDQIKYALVGYSGTLAICCGAIKEYEPGIVEIKRMFTVKEARGAGVASIVLAELETWAWELNYDTCILETGKRQPEAISLYKKNGYSLIPNYGQYANDENSLCFEKQIAR